MENHSQDLYLFHFLYNWISSEEPQNVTLYEFGWFETVLWLVALIDTLYIIKNLEISSFPQPKIEENIWLALSETHFEYEANTFFMSHCTNCLREKRCKITFSAMTSAQLIGFWHIDHQNLCVDIGQCLEAKNTQKWWNRLRNTWFFKTYSVTSKISKLFKMSVESKEVKSCFVLC